MITLHNLAELLVSRERWLRLDVVPSQHHRDGRGWDIVLRLDGAYSNREQAEDVRQYFTDTLADTKNPETTTTEENR
jgi:hypothetical protein